MTVLAALLTGTGSALAAVAPAIAAPAVAAPIGAGSVVKLTASDDTYSSSGHRSSTYGGADRLLIGRLNSDTSTAYLKFVVPAGAGVTAARLNLTTAPGAAGTITVSRVLSNEWTESKLSSDNAPSLGLAVASATAKVTAKPAATALSFDLSAEVTGPGTYSFALRSSGPDAVTRIHSAEATDGRPELVVTTGAATDEPDPVLTGPTAPATEPTTTPPATTPPATTPPATTPPATTPPVATPPNTGNCTTGALLVPSCGVLWGAAAGGFTDKPRDVEVKNWEKLSGRTATIFHTYHKGNEPFPTKDEIAMTSDPAHPRVLLMNWKIAYGSTWAKVAAGQQDKRIDAFAVRAKAYGKKFFLVLNHEPENDVIARSGSGMEARDFAAMYRHTILRLRAHGVTNAINVVAYMGNEKWMSQSWWKDLYPGDDVVDWMGLDSYVSAEKDYYHYGVFADLLDRAGTDGQGFYDWATTRHAAKPMMVVEWGVYHRLGHVADKSAAYHSVLPELRKRPAIKAIVYFDTKRDDEGNRDISIDSSKPSLAAFRNLAANPIFNVKLG